MLVVKSQTGLLRAGLGRTKLLGWVVESALLEITTALGLKEEERELFNLIRLLTIQKKLQDKGSRN